MINLALLFCSKQATICALSPLCVRVFRDTHMRALLTPMMRVQFIYCAFVLIALAERVCFAQRSRLACHMLLLSGHSFFCVTFAIFFAKCFMAPFMGGGAQTESFASSCCAQTRTDREKALFFVIFAQYIDSFKTNLLVGPFRPFNQLGYVETVFVL